MQALSVVDDRLGKVENKVLQVVEMMALWADMVMSLHWKEMSVRQFVLAKYQNVL